MLKTVIKRDGQEEPVDYSKPAKWAKWAGPDLDWGSIFLTVMQSCPEEKLSTSEIQNRFISELVSRNDHDCMLMAGRLYMGPLQRKLLGKDKKTLIKQIADMVALGQMAPMSYSKEDYEYFDSLIEHERDLTYDYTQILQITKKYSLRDRANKGKDPLETPQFTFMRMAMALSEYYPPETRRGHVFEFYDQFSHNIVSAPTPNYNNLGTHHRGLASCCLYSITDTTESIAAGKHIAFIMTAMSAGLGEFCQTRSLGDGVANNTVVAIGKVPHFRGLVGDCSELTKGGRGGSATSYYTCFDPEASEIVMLQNPLLPHDKAVREIHYAMELNKFFIKRALNNQDVYTFNIHTAPKVHEAFFGGSPEEFERIYFEHESKVGKSKLNYISARKLLTRLAVQFYEAGTNYSADMDEINRHTPYKEPIRQSNLCVAPETLLLTDKGHLEIAPLAGSTVNVWNGQGWSPAPVVKTGVAQKLLSVVTDSGETLDCTEYHKWYVHSDDSSEIVEKRTFELKVGDRLVKFDLPVIHGENTLDLAYVNGFYSGDGCLTKDGQRIYLYDTKRKLAGFFTTGSDWINQPGQGRMYKHYKELKEKFFVPDAGYTVASRLHWLAGYADADGCIQRNGDNQSLVMASINWDFLRDVQLMLQTLGVNSKIRDMREETLREMPLNNGTDEVSLFKCKRIWRLMVSSKELQHLVSIGFKPNRLRVVDHQPQRSATKFVRVRSVTDSGRISDTYCVTEPIRHMAVFNGILTGNCTEVTQPTYPYESVVDLYLEEDHGRGEVSLCSLGAIVVPAVIKRAKEMGGDFKEAYAKVYAKAAEYALRMVDYCIEYADYALPHVGYTAKKRRNAGIGVIGAATVMAMEGKKYSTMEGVRLLHDMAEDHAYHCIRASIKLGKELGNAPWIHKTKWPEGWTPLKTYNRNVDEILPPIDRYDWDQVSQDLIECGGGRFSALITHQPTESSSKATGYPRGWYPVTDLHQALGDADNIIPWCAYNNMRLPYEIAWSVPMDFQIYGYAGIQKWTDQATSADYHADRSVTLELKVSNLLREIALASKYGVKTRYYTKSLTVDESGEKHVTEVTDNCVGGCKV